MVWWYDGLHMQLPYRKPGKYAQAPSDHLMTEEKLNELKGELFRLKEKRPKAAAEVARLAELGDFSENVEYQMAKGRLRGINNAMLKLEYEINHAEIIALKKKSGFVNIGSTVTIEGPTGQKTYQILGSSETNPAKGIISHTSPLGEALLGRRTGDHLVIKRANGETAYTIIRIG